VARYDESQKDIQPRPRICNAGQANAEDDSTMLLKHLPKNQVWDLTMKCLVDWRRIRNLEDRPCLNLEGTKRLDFPNQGCEFRNGGACSLGLEHLNIPVQLSRLQKDPSSSQNHYTFETSASGPSRVNVLIRGIGS
jgi:hypothetical protein